VAWNKARLWRRGLEPAEYSADELSYSRLMKADVCWSAGLGLSAVDRLRTAAFQSEFMLHALDVGEPNRAARALATEASELACYGGAERLKRAHAVFARALQVAERANEPSTHAFLHLMGGTINFYEGRFRDALEECRRAENMLRERCRDSSWEMTICHLLSLASLVYLGDLKTPRKLIEIFRREAKERGDRYAEVTLPSGLINMIWLADDQAEEARDRCDQALASWPSSDFQFQHYLSLIAQTQIDLYEGHADVALERIEGAWKQLKSSYHLKVQHFRVTMFHLRARALIASAFQALENQTRSFAGQISRMRLIRRARSDVAAIEREETAWGRALARTLRGALAVLDGEKEQAIAELEAAARELGELGMELYAAAALRRAGELRGGDQGRAQVEEAGARMDVCGVLRPSRVAAVLVPAGSTGTGTFVSTRATQSI
jgi:eukaryotic-like serine/threonine-protein kinase